MNKMAAKRKAFWERNRKSEGYLLKKTLMNQAVRIARAVLLFGLCFLILQPILNKISISFMAEEDLYNSTIINVPEHFTTYNYRISAEIMEYDKAFLSTVIISLTIALLQVAVCTVVGYGFARFDFPFKKFWFACVLLVIVVPPQTISTSLYLHFRYFDVLGIVELLKDTTINLRGSKIPYYLMSSCCMGLKNGLYIYMTRQYFRNIPKEMEEAAYVDGCGTMRTFLRIMLPDAKPIFTSCFLFAFVWEWTDSFYANMFMGRTKLLATELAVLGDRFDTLIAQLNGTPSGASVSMVNAIISTGTLMVIVPLLVLYIFAQRGFVESLSSTGVKM